MASDVHNPLWTWAVPAVSWGILGVSFFSPAAPFLPLLFCLGLIGGVIAAVHHAEVIAHRVGEPYGTLVLALSVTSIEVALIISLILAGGDGAMGLLRDTLFAAVMIILNGIIGLSLLVGGQRHRVQNFNVEGMTDAVATTALIIAMGFVLPNFVSGPAPGSFTPLQLSVVSVATLVIFVAFILFQTVLHRDYFITALRDAEGASVSAPPDARTTWASLALLLVSLVAVVLSAKAISPTLEGLLSRMGAPAATLGILIAAIVLLPEFAAAMRAARADRLQSSLNLAVGSAIASIGLTLPVVGLLAVVLGWQLDLGLDGKSTALLVLTLFVVALSLRTGRTTVLPGVLHVVLFAVWLAFSFLP